MSRKGQALRNTPYAYSGRAGIILSCVAHAEGTPYAIFDYGSIGMEPVVTHMGTPDDITAYTARDPDACASTRSIMYMCLHRQLRRGDITWIWMSVSAATTIGNIT